MSDWKTMANYLNLSGRTPEPIREPLKDDGSFNKLASEFKAVLSLKRDDLRQVFLALERSLEEEDGGARRPEASVYGRLAESLGEQADSEVGKKLLELMWNKILSNGAGSIAPELTNVAVDPDLSAWRRDEDAEGAAVQKAAYGEFEKRSSDLDAIDDIEDGDALGVLAGASNPGFFYRLDRPMLRLYKNNRFGPLLSEKALVSRKRRLASLKRNVFVQPRDYGGNDRVVFKSPANHPHRMPVQEFAETKARLLYKIVNGKALVYESLEKSVHTPSALVTLIVDCAQPEWGGGDGSQAASKVKALAGLIVDFLFHFMADVRIARLDLEILIFRPSRLLENDDDQTVRDMFEKVSRDLSARGGRLQSMLTLVKKRPFAFDSLNFIDRAGKVAGYRVVESALCDLQKIAGSAKATMMLKKLEGSTYLDRDDFLAAVKQCLNGLCNAKAVREVAGELERSCQLCSETLTLTRNMKEITGVVSDKPSSRCTPGQRGRLYRLLYGVLFKRRHPVRVSRDGILDVDPNALETLQIVDRFLKKERGDPRVSSAPQTDYAARHVCHVLPRIADSEKKMERDKLSRENSGLVCGLELSNWPKLASPGKFDTLYCFEIQRDEASRLSFRGRNLMREYKGGREEMSEQDYMCEYLSNIMDAVERMHSWKGGR